MDFFRQYIRSAELYIKFLSLKEQVLIVFFLCSLLFSVFFVTALSSPSNFQKFTTVRIEKGSGLSTTASILGENHIIASPSWFKVITVLSGRSRSVIAGDYYFARAENVFDVIHRVSRGDYNLVEVRITIPEGLTVFQIAEILHSKLIMFDTKQFVELAAEGYLFPDTYFFLPNATNTEVIEKMRRNFDAKIIPLLSDIEKTEKTLKDIITMASIIEEEAKHDEDRPKISSVLWNRIAIDMPLQVDAAFSYVNGKHTYTLTKEDLFDESPYNTYRNKGLPPTPIANPGIESIKASINPANTDYLYFLSDLSGKMYYAKDFDGHQKNRELYLRK